jgi:hypothetical protein
VEPSAEKNYNNSLLASRYDNNQPFLAVSYITHNSMFTHTPPSYAEINKQRQHTMRQGNSIPPPLRCHSGTFFSYEIHVGAQQTSGAQHHGRVINLLSHQTPSSMGHTPPQDDSILSCALRAPTHELRNLFEGSYLHHSFTKP